MDRLADFAVRDTGVVPPEAPSPAAWRGTPSISIIVSTCDRAATLADCLASLRRQTHGDFEVIVVAGPCRDATAQVLSAHASHLKIVDCPERNLARSRNLGIAAAAGEVCAFIDDDAVAHPAWLERLSGRYADAAVGGVGGFTIDNTGTRFQCRYTICDRFGNATLLDHVDPAARLSQAGLWAFPSLLGTNASFRTALLRRIGGFDERFEYMLDETDVCLRITDLGSAIVTEPRALVFHRYAESHVRDHRRIARTLLAPSRSKAHFVLKHAQPRLRLTEIAAEIDRFRADLCFSNRWHVDRALIDGGHFLRLNREVEAGLREGMESGARAAAGGGSTDAARFAAAPLPLRRFPAPAAQRLRVALVSQGYPPQDTAGIARWTQALATALNERGHDVHVITATDAERRIDYRGGVWVHAVPPQNGAREAPPVDLPPAIGARAAAVLTEARRIRREFGLDVLSAPIWDVEGILCAAHLDVPVVTSLHTACRMALPLKPQWRSDLGFRFHHVERVMTAERWLLRHAALLLANSQEICRALQSLYEVAFDPARIAVVPHGLPPATAAECASAPAPDDRLRVLHVGRIERRKGADLLLRAIGPLLERHPALVLDVAGAPVPEEDDFTALIARLRAGLPADRVCFHGYVADAALARLYAACDVFVAPSRFESFGLIAIEAMRFGKPVVATNAGGLAEIVDHGISGELFESESVPGLRKALQRLLADPARRRRAGQQAAARFAANFTSDGMAAQVERCLCELVAQHAGGPAPGTSV